MGKIKVLNQSLANKIAAGEVYERISNVVKELCENSIDANASVIRIDLIDSGKTKIVVTDNGDGMDKEDAHLCFLRHATSKISKDDDLFFINSLGFRGEALASIASVSKVYLETNNGIKTTCLTVENSIIEENNPQPMKKGTKITISNLFYNTPARLKYLKSDRAELNQIIYFVEKLALANPDISITLNNNNRNYVKTSGSKDTLKTIHEIYGLEVSQNMIKIDASSDDYDITGYICKPEVLRKNRNQMNIVINGRIIKNFELLKVVDEAYHTYKPDKFYPVVLIYISTDPSLIDVNVHPTKQDIKFSKVENLLLLIKDTIKEALYDNILTPKAVKTYYPEETLEEELPKNLFIEENNYPKYSFNTFNSSFSKESNVQQEIDFKKVNDKFKKIEFYPVGLAFGTYIVAEDKDNLYLIDQHAAQERINYEKTLKQMNTNHKISMLIPIIIELTKSEFDTINNHLDILFNMGFEISIFGNNTFKVDAHPTWIKTGLEEQTIKEVFATLIEEKNNFKLEKFNDKVAATIACKMSIKGNSRITLEAANFILEELSFCVNPYNCPHGRPTIIKFSTYELEKMFKRSM